MLPGNPCKSALVYFSKSEFLNFGLSGRDLTLQNRKTLLLLEKIFALLEECAGLRRDGHFVCVLCRPLHSGGCRFFIQFTEEPCGRSFDFSHSDNLLDALNQLQRLGKPDIVSRIGIFRSGGTHKIYIPAGLPMTQAEIAALYEYSG